MLKTELNIDVRYYETDQMGIVHHSNYLRYFECGRVDLLKKIGLPIEKIEESGVMMPVVSLNCHYRTPAKLGDSLNVITYIEELPKARLDIRNEIFNQDGMLVCEGSVMLGFINSETRRPVRCPKSLLNIFEQHFND
ncbi:MAG: acyl-CoA thioesterase [Bacteroidales bacterium]|nr:acyl-CoA thioesterase [Bacteroidales bacterium]